MDFITRLIAQQEIDQVYALISKEGWNLTEQKFKVFCQAHPRDVYITVTKDNEIVATVSYFQTFTDEYILCNLVVKGSMRKQGLGRRIVLDTLAMFEHRVVQLTALPGTESFYHKLQFRSCDPKLGHEIFHLTVDRELLFHQIAQDDNSTSVVPFAPSLLNKLIAYDNGIRGYDNSVFVNRMVDTSKVLVATGCGVSHDAGSGVSHDAGSGVSHDAGCGDMATVEGKVVGYVAAYLRGEELVLDGLFADADSVALLLFDGILKLFPKVRMLKLQMFSHQHFLLQYGSVTSSYVYSRLSLGAGEPSYISTQKTYNVTEYD